MADECVIWGDGFTATRRPDPNRYGTIVENSPRAGGGYRIGHSVAASTKRLADEEKARLTTWIVDQNAQGVRLPEITNQVVEYTRNKESLPVYERANRLLRWIAGQIPSVGHGISITFGDHVPLAWSESTTVEELLYFMVYLKDRDWLGFNRTKGGFFSVVVTVDGYIQIESTDRVPDYSQGFVAMWFDESMKGARDKGIKQAIIDAGYKPYVVDEDDFVDKIDDKILAEIRRSRFIVADVTHGEKGARGGVYFEAGFAFGLGLEVIYTCRKDKLDDVHFDTRQFPHIVWETPEELREALTNRIGRILGQGPESPT